MTLVFLLMACSDKPVDDSGGTADGCTALTDGDWSATGSAFAMTMSVTVTMDAGACAFTFSDWSAGMGHPVPDGGTVQGDQVTFTGDVWEGCVGTAADAETISGECDDAGGSFEMSYAG